MIPSRVGICIFLSASIAGASAQSMAPRQSDASYEAAIHNLSTAPSYDSITVIDSRSGVSRTTCTTANFLLGALHREYGFGYDAAGRSRVEQIALSNRSHIFRLEKKEAIDNIPFRFSMDDLALARGQWKDFSPSQLRDFVSSHGPIQQAGSPGRPKEYETVRDVMACVLIEHGLSPRQGDLAGALLFDP